MGPTKRVHINESGRTTRETVTVTGPEETVGHHCIDVVLTAAPNTPAMDLLEALLEHGAHAAVIIDGAAPIGVVSLTDLSRAAAQDRLRDPPESNAFDPTYDSHTRAKDVMHSPAFTCTPDESLTLAARRMATKNVRQLPVVNAGGEVVSLLRSIDVLRVLSAP